MGYQLSQVSEATALNKTGLLSDQTLQQKGNPIWWAAGRRQRRAPPPASGIKTDPPRGQGPPIWPLGYRSEFNLHIPDSQVRLLETADKDAP